MGGSQIAPRHLRSVVHQARWRLWILCVSSLSTLAPARDFLDYLLGSWPGISVYNVFVFIYYTGNQTEQNPCIKLHETFAGKTQEPHNTNSCILSCAGSYAA